MRLSKVFRQTLHITNSTRTEADGMCANSPQVYRRSLPTLQRPPLETNQPQTQEVYEDVDSAWRPSPPISDLRIAGRPRLPAPNGPNRVKMTSSPIPQAAKDKKKKKVQTGPTLNSLPSVFSLGPPPPKPPRPLNVDLSAFFTLQQNGENAKPEDSSEVDYELPAPSPTSNEDELYDEVFSPKASTESGANAYELDDAEYDVPEVVSLAPDTSSLKEPHKMLHYKEIRKLRERSYGRHVYGTVETNPVSRPQMADGCAYEVSVNDDTATFSHSSTMTSDPSDNSSVSGYYSADLDTSNKSIQKESKSMEEKIGASGQTLRNRFKLSGQEEILYKSRILEDLKTERFLLSVKKGGTDGLVPVVGFQVIDDKKRLLPSADQDVYVDVEVKQKESSLCADALKGADSYSVKSDDLYDDISNTSQSSNGSRGKGKVFGHLFKKDKSMKDDVRYASVFPDLNRTASQESEEYKPYPNCGEQEREKEEKFPGWKSLFHKNKEQKATERKGFSSASGVKTLAKEERMFREKFKYTGKINLVNVATVNDLAPLSPKDKLELAVKPGETVEVLDITSEDRIVCRNFAGKYGFVRIESLNV
ncbi:FYN-binding protein 2 [Eleutherodactylus coqui]|uniref:FYN-binding protein 2 n=1 Tax=Eleutherodactylus coqui TaxID=57060 RepID=UPI003463255F